MSLWGNINSDYSLLVLVADQDPVVLNGFRILGPVYEQKVESGSGLNIKIPLKSIFFLQKL